MKTSSAVLALFILISDIFVSASNLEGNAVIKIGLEQSNMFVRCGSAEYTSVEIDNAATKACYLKLTEGKKFLGFRLRPQPKVYQGDKHLIFDANYESPNHYSHHNTHILNLWEHPLLMWPLKNKFKRSKAKCYAIISWNPGQVKCKAIAVIMREKETEVKCSQVTIPRSNSKYAGSPLYFPGDRSPQRPESPIPFEDWSPSSAHGTARIPPFNSPFNSPFTSPFNSPLNSIQEDTDESTEAPSFKIYQYP